MQATKLVNRICSLISNGRMKFVLLFLGLVVITAPTYGQFPRTRQVHPYSLDNVNKQVESDLQSIQANSILPGLQLYLPSWLKRWLPDIDRILSSSLNILEGMPASVVSSSINKICSVAITTGFLKPSYTIPEQRVALELYTGNEVVEFPVGDVTRLLSHSGYNANKNITIFVTSWGAKSDEQDRDNIVYVLAQAYKKRGTDNFILFDVSDFVDTIYHWLTLDTRSIGRVLGDAIVRLSRNVPVSNIHIIGHDLGAHIAGNAGRRVQEVKRQQIARITALDPPKICYDDSDGFYGIQPGDAEFVDVIHSNNDVLGKKNPVGDADFYPNGPIYLQPGCYDVVCSHKRAVLYYAESVVPGAERNFLAQNCPSLSNMKKENCRGMKIPMGLATPPSARGPYFLETNKEPSYGKDASSDYPYGQSTVLSASNANDEGANSNADQSLNENSEQAM